MGPLSVEIGNIMHKYIKKVKKYIMIALNSLFQVLKYLNLMPLPGVGNNFEIESIIYGIFGGSIYLAYKHDRNIFNTPRSNSI